MLADYVRKLGGSLLRGIRDDVEDGRTLFRAHCGLRQRFLLSIIGLWKVGHILLETCNIQHEYSRLWECKEERLFIRTETDVGRRLGKLDATNAL